MEYVSNLRFFRIQLVVEADGKAGPRWNRNFGRGRWRWRRAWLVIVRGVAGTAAAVACTVASGATVIRHGRAQTCVPAAAAGGGG